LHKRIRFVQVNATPCPPPVSNIISMKIWRQIFFFKFDINLYGIFLSFKTLNGVFHFWIKKQSPKSQKCSYGLDFFNLIIIGFRPIQTVIWLDAYLCHLKCSDGTIRQEGLIKKDSFGCLTCECEIERETSCLQEGGEAWSIDQPDLKLLNFYEIFKKIICKIYSVFE